MKRKLTFFIAAFMAASSFSVTSYAAKFYDIDNVPWDGAKAYINNVAELGLMEGDIHPTTGKPRFRARDKVTYCETTQLAYSVLKKTNKLKKSDVNLVSKWTHVMKSYNVPAWAYEAVSYALETNVVSLTDVSRFMSRTGNKVKDNYASRESVAVIFGKALSELYPVNQNVTLAFHDKASIASTSVPYVDLLARLQILVGDTDKNFTPKAYINRAEMAVLTLKTFNTVNGTSTTPTQPTQPTQPDGTMEMKGTVASIEDYGSNKLLAVQTLDGQKQGFLINSTTFVLKGETAGQLHISDLGVGDGVSVNYLGAKVNVIRILNDVSPSIAKEVTGTVDEITNSKIYLLNNDKKVESFGYADKYTMTLNGKNATMKDIFDEYKEKSLKATLSLDSSGLATIIKVTSSEESGFVGILYNITDDELSYKKTSSSRSEDYQLGNDVTIQLEKRDTTISKVRSALKDDTLYVKFYVDSKDKVKKILVSEDKFSDFKDDSSEITGIFNSFDSDRIRVKGFNNKGTESFNLKSSTKYYLEGEEDSFRAVNLAYNRADNKGNDFYARVLLDSSGKVDKLYASTDKSGVDGVDYKKSIDGIMMRIDDAEIRIDTDRDGRSNYRMSSDVSYYLESKSSNLRSVERAFTDAQDDRDDFYVTIYLDKNDRVIKVDASAKRTSAGRELSGDINKVTKSTITLKSNSTRDLASDVSIKLDGETSSVSKLIEALDDRDRTFSAELTIKNDEVTKIDAHTVSVFATLESVNRADSIIKVKTKDAGRLTFELESRNVPCTGDYKRLYELEADLDLYEINVDLKLTDSKVTEIYSRRR